MYHLRKLEVLSVNLIGIWIIYKKGALSIGNCIVMTFLIVHWYTLITACVLFINDAILFDLFKQTQ